MAGAGLVETSACVHTVIPFLAEKLICSRDAEKAEKELLTILALKEPTYAEIDVLIAK